MIHDYLKGYPKFEKDQKLVGRFPLLLESWKKSYPLVDIKEQIGWSHAWLLSSGKRYEDMSRFINNWLMGCQKRYLEITSKTLKLKPYIETRPDESELPGEEDFKRMKESLRINKTNDI